MSGETTLRAGAGCADITPEMGIQIAGDIGRYRPVEEIREPIHARALMMEQTGRKFCVLSLELPAIRDDWVAEIRARAADRFGLGPSAVMVHAHQNHAAPSIGHFMLSDNYAGLPDDLWWVRGGDDRYNEPAVQGILEAIAKADASLQPVTVHVGREIDGRVAFNRRFVMRDGTARGHPKQHERTAILHCEGPIDPEVGVAVLRGEDGRAVAALLHHTCHPVHGYPRRYVIAGWPGAWAAGMSAPLGDECVSLVLNGCCGNVHHANHLDPKHVDNYVRMGSLLTESASEALRSMEEVTAPLLDWRTETVKIPLRELDPEQVEAARKMLAEHPAPIWKQGAEKAIEWDWVYAAGLLDLAAERERQSWYDYEVQALRLGQIAVVALTGEPFVEAQLAIKLKSPAVYTFVAHMSNGYVGYIPTPEALKRGGYETRVGNWSKLAPDALEMITRTSLDVLGDLF